MIGRQHVVLIQVFANRRLINEGTGFCVAPGVLVTALHVVAARGDGPPQALGTVRVQASILRDELFDADPLTLDWEVVDYDREHDWIALGIDEPDFDAPVLKLSALTSSMTNRDWTSYGFPNRDRAGVALGGTVTSIHAQHPDGDGRRVVQLVSTEVGFGASVPGFSGAPVMHGDHVVAVIQSIPTNQGPSATIYAIPTEVIAQRLKVAMVGARPRARGQVRRELCFDRVEQKGRFNAVFESKTLPALVPIAGAQDQVHDEFARFCEHWLVSRVEPEELLIAPVISWDANRDLVECRSRRLLEQLEAGIARALGVDGGGFDSIPSDIKAVFVRHEIRYPQVDDDRVLAAYLCAVAEQLGRCDVQFAATFEYWLPTPSWFPFSRSFWEALGARKVVRACARVLMHHSLHLLGPPVPLFELGLPGVDEVVDAAKLAAPRFTEDEVRAIYRASGGSMIGIIKRLGEATHA